jgi:trans-aconitate methyltransferase
MSAVTAASSHVRSSTRPAYGRVTTHSTWAVGRGPGALTSELVALFGADEVAAVDPSVPFVEACRRRVPGVAVEVASARHCRSGTPHSTMRSPSWW